MSGNKKMIAIGDIRKGRQVQSQLVRVISEKSGLKLSVAQPLGDSGVRL